MPKPASVTDFGTVVPGAAPHRPDAYHARFVDVKTYAAGVMPTVKVGQIYEDLDPRRAGRRVQVLRLDGDGRVLVRTTAPRAGATSAAESTGGVSWIALRRFRENSRGFRLVRTAPLRSVQSYLLAVRLADACDLAVTETEIRAADALIGLLGNRLAHEYLDTLTSIDTSNGTSLAVAVYVHGGLADLFHDAVLFAEEAELTHEWEQVQVASARTTRQVASLT